MMTMSKQLMSCHKSDDDLEVMISCHKDDDDVKAVDVLS